MQTVWVNFALKLVYLAFLGLQVRDHDQHQHVQWRVMIIQLVRVGAREPTKSREICLQCNFRVCQCFHYVLTIYSFSPSLHSVFGILAVYLLIGSFWLTIRAFIVCLLSLYLRPKLELEYYLLENPRRSEK